MSEGKKTCRWRAAWSPWQRLAKQWDTPIMKLAVFLVVTGCYLSRVVVGPGLDTPQGEAKRAKRVEFVMIGKLVCSAGCLLLLEFTDFSIAKRGAGYSWLLWLCLPLTGVFLVDTAATAIYAALFRRRGKIQRPSLERNVVLGLLNFFEVTVAFGVLHRIFYVQKGVPIGWCEAMYFSTVTALTIGYGDMAPDEAWGRMVVMGQGAVMLVIVTVLIARMLGSMDAIGQDGASEQAKETSEAINCGSENTKVPRPG